MLNRSDTSSDPLSDILSLLKPRSIACGAIDAGDACIAFPAAQGIKCHAVTLGKAWLLVDGVSAPVRLSAGDCFLLPHGRPYRLASDPALPATDYRTVLAESTSGHIRVWNDGGKVTVFSAAFTVDAQHAGLLLDVLPPIAHIHVAADRAALGRSLEQMMRELRDPQPGGRYIVEHLAMMLLALALRTYLAQARGDRVGWLFALADKRIARAIGAMHADPAHRWTVEALACRAGMSRTSFAVRFRTSVGSSPIEYLTKVRLHLARDRLATSKDTLSEVAVASGYMSESAFSNAFKRHMGCSPRRFAKSASARLSASS